MSTRFSSEIGRNRLPFYWYVILVAYPMTNVIILTLLGVKKPNMGYPKNVLRTKNIFDPPKFGFWGYLGQQGQRHIRFDFLQQFVSLSFKISWSLVSIACHWHLCKIRHQTTMFIMSPDYHVHFVTILQCSFRHQTTFILSSYYCIQFLYRLCSFHQQTTS